MAWSGSSWTIGAKLELQMTPRAPLSLVTNEWADSRWWCFEGPRCKIWGRIKIGRWFYRLFGKFWPESYQNIWAGSVVKEKVQNNQRIFWSVPKIQIWFHLRMKSFSSILPVLQVQSLGRASPGQRPMTAAQCGELGLIQFQSDIINRSLVQCTSYKCMIPVTSMVGSV